MAKALKDVYSKDFIEKLSNKISSIYLDFKKDEFIKAIFNSNWQNLELKSRVRHISTILGEFLPFSYAKQLEILKEAKKDFASLQAIVFQDFVQVFGLNYLEDSLKALEYFTINSSSEFAIREFIIKYEEKTVVQMKIWAQSQDKDIRRLASEGVRPRLPWATALPNFKKDPRKVFEIIEILKNDEEKYVQKSVANNLNDISKDNPCLVIEFVKNNIGISKNLDWICRHGSRTLLKNGNKEILKLFGFKELDNIDILNFYCDQSVKIGQNLNFSFELVSNSALGNLRIEYEINYLKQKGKYSKKIYMITQNSFMNSSKKFSKKQSFKDMTIRKHIKGIHNLSIVINGERLATKDFIVT